jgi:membrane fusion protein, multidrug efflux system
MRKLLVLGFAVAILAAGLGGWLASNHQSVQAAAPFTPPAVPVTTAPVKSEDVPVYLRGLGTVQALNTVEIKSQANGTLLSLPVHEGQEVHPGDVVALIDPRPYEATLDQAIAQKARDQASLWGAQLDLQRYQTLYRDGNFAAQQQVQDQQATVKQLQAAVRADSAAIAAAQINLNYCTIRAPVSGRVSLYQTDAGNLIEVSNQTGIVSIAQDKPIAVVFTLPEEDLLRVQDAMRKGRLPVVVYASDDKTKLADGTLLTPNNAISTSTGTIEFKAIFANNDYRLWPGEFINARLLVETLHNAVTVPLAAIQHGPNGLYVYTVDPNEPVQSQSVEVGYQDTSTAVVTKGLQPGQTVVVAGQSRLSPGTRVATNAGSVATSTTAENTAAASR